MKIGPSFLENKIFYMISKIAIIIFFLFCVNCNTYAQEFHLTEGFRNPGKEFRPMTDLRQFLGIEATI